MKKAAGFLARLVRKADQDDIFFMSGAIAFNLIVAVLPMLIFALGLAGFIFEARFADPGGQAMLTIQRLLPPSVADADLLERLGRAVEGAIESRTRYSLIGFILLMFFSTRLAATLRSVLRTVFEVPVRRPLVRSKLLDMQIVLVGGLIVLLDLALTAGAAGYGINNELVEFPKTLVTMWLLFGLIFRYVPARPTPWATVWVGATIAAFTFALMRLGMGLYLTRFASLASAFDGFAALVILYLFLYYSAVLFVVSAEAAYLTTHPEGRVVGAKEPSKPSSDEGTSASQDSVVEGSGPEPGSRHEPEVALETVVDA